MTPRAARLLRGTLLGGVATLVAAVSHLVGGGAAPSGLALLAGGVFAALVGTLAVGRDAGAAPLGRIRTIAGVALAQLAFHLGFSLLGTGAAVTSSGAHHHELFAIAAGPASASPAGAGMWFAHLAAGGLTVLYLRRLEAHAWGLLTRLGRFALRTLGIRMPATPARTPRPAACRTRTAASARLRDAIARRGPPAPARA